MKKIILGVILVSVITGCTIPASIGNQHVYQPDVDSLFMVACRSSSIERIIAHTSMALKEDSSCVDCYLLRAVSWLRIGQLNEAYADIRRAAFIEPTLFPAVKELHLGKYSYRSLIDQFRALYVGRLTDCQCVNKTIFSNTYTAISEPLDSVEKISISTFSERKSQINNSSPEYTQSEREEKHLTATNTQTKRISKRSKNQESPESSFEKTARQTDDHRPVNKRQRENTALNEHSRNGLASDSCSIAQARREKSSEKYLCILSRMYKNRQFKKLLSLSREAMKLKNDFGDLHLLRAKSFGALHKYRKALKAVRKAIRHSPNNSSYYLVEAWIYHCQGKYKKERKSLHTALRLGSDKRSIIEMRLENIADK
ncbi:MAG: hypothetical protein ACLFSB_16045 [Chitinispirillaceae bacterium]